MRAFGMRNHVCNNHHRHCTPRGAHSLHRRQSQATGTLRPAKLAAWERSNGVGRLVKKEPPRVYPTWTAPASFTLHEGNFASDGVILVTIMRCHSAESQLMFEVCECWM